MRRRVVVTGMGAITPIGNSVEEFWNAVREEKTGYVEITHFDASGYKRHLASEVKKSEGCRRSNANRRSFWKRDRDVSIRFWCR